MTTSAPTATRTATLRRDVFMRQTVTTPDGLHWASAGQLVPAGTEVYVGRERLALHLKSGTMQPTHEIRLPGTLLTQIVFDTTLRFED